MPVRRRAASVWLILSCLVLPACGTATIATQAEEPQTPATSATTATDPVTEGTATKQPASKDARPSGPAAVAPTPEQLDFRTTTLSGSQFAGAELAGRPAVLWFWAPWCTICRTEAPEVARIAESLEGDVRFLGVPGLGDVEDMQQFVQDTGTGELTHLVDEDGSLWARFGVIAQPAFAFVSADGEVEVVNGSLPPDDLIETARSLTTG